MSAGTSTKVTSAGSTVPTDTDVMLTLAVGMWLEWKCWVISVRCCELMLTDDPEPAPCCELPLDDWLLVPEPAGLALPEDVPDEPWLDPDVLFCPVPVPPEPLGAELP